MFLYFICKVSAENICAYGDLRGIRGHFTFHKTFEFINYMYIFVSHYNPMKTLYLLLFEQNPPKFKLVHDTTVFLFYGINHLKDSYSVDSS